MWSLTLNDSRADAGMYSYSFSQHFVRNYCVQRPVQEVPEVKKAHSLSSQVLTKGAEPFIQFNLLNKCLLNHEINYYKASLRLTDTSLGLLW